MPVDAKPGFKREGAFLYQALAAEMSDLIASGTLRTGDKLPSVRKLSRSRQVSVATVLQAYLHLESQGFIEARPQSGYFVRSRQRRVLPEPQPLKTSPVSADVGMDLFINQVLESSRDPNIVPLGNYWLHDSLLPTTKLYRTLAAVARHTETNAYEPAQGNEALRRQIALRSLEAGCSLAAEDIQITCGCTEAINLCLRAVAQPGDTIAVESPTYFGILQIIEGLGMKVLEIPCHAQHGMNLEYLESALQRCPIKACVSVPNFNNPLGSCMPDQRKQQLVEMLTSRDIPVIEDDLFGEFSIGRRPLTLKSFDREGLVLLCSSFSKTMSPGFRVGWTVPGRFREQVLRLKRMSTLATATLPQMAIAEFLANGGFDHHLRRLNRALAEQLQLTSQAVAEYFPKGTRISRPAGGFVLWVELPADVDALALHQKALEHDISVAPGPIFSVNRQYRNFLRLNCGNPWSDKIEKALYLLGILAKGKEI